MEPLMASVSLQKSGRLGAFSLSLHVRTQQEVTHLQVKGGQLWAGNGHLEARSAHRLAGSGVHQDPNLSALLILESPTPAVRTKCLVHTAPTVVFSGSTSCWSGVSLECSYLLHLGCRGQRSLLCTSLLAPDFSLC